MKITALPAPIYTMPPTLETERLRLRPHRASDLAPLAQMWGDPETVRFIGGKTRTPDVVWQQIQSKIGAWVLLGYGFWVVELKETGAVIGEMGFLQGLRGVGDDFSGLPEAGWVLAKSAWGLGLASEGLRAIMDWADQCLPAPKTLCMIESGHGASDAVARKLGYIPIRETVYNGAPVFLYAREAR